MKYKNKDKIGFNVKLIGLILTILICMLFIFASIYFLTVTNLFFEKLMLCSDIIIMIYVIYIAIIKLLEHFNFFENDKYLKTNSVIFRIFRIFIIVLIIMCLLEFAFFIVENDYIIDLVTDNIMFFSIVVIYYILCKLSECTKTIVTKYLLLEYGILLFIVGIIFVVINVPTYRDYDSKDSQYIFIYSDVINISDDSMKLQYVVDGITYQKDINIQKNTPSRVAIKYNPLNPSEIIMDDIADQMLLMLVIFGMYALVGLLAIINSFNHLKLYIYNNIHFSFKDR